MHRKLANLIFGLLCAVVVSSCGISDETKDDTAEEARLKQSFSTENVELQQHVAGIITQSKALEYQRAMNKLALLSATKRLTHEQKIAVDFMIRKLRYDMEEAIFSQQGRQE